MPFWTWDPASEIEALRQEMTRAFESAGLDTGHQGRTRASFLPGVHARAYPRLNVGEDAERFYIEALAPGVDPGTLEITVEKNTIRIAGQKRGAANDVPAEAYHRSERAVGQFARALALPSDIDAGKVTAEYDNGLLLVTAPKAEAVKPKRIKVRAA